MYRLISCCCLLMQSGLKTGSLLVRLGKLLLHSAMVLLLTFTINYLAKVLLPFSPLPQPVFPFSFSSLFIAYKPLFLLSFSRPLECFPLIVSHL